jgi:glucan 1,3-beta-glucosidase
LSSTKNIFGGQLQTETAYYQPNPPATIPFAPISSYNDPDFAAYCKDKTGTCGSGWGLRVLDSEEILFYGVGLYSFFSNYSTSCSDAGNGETCQTQIFGLDTGSARDRGTSKVYVYNLNTIGSVSMIDRGEGSIAKFSDNVNVFPDTIALFRTN